MQTSKRTLVKVTMFLSSCVVALLVYGVAFFQIPHLPDDRLRSACSSIGGAAGTLLGFLIAAMSIIASSGNRKFVGNMTKVGLYDRLITETLATCVLLLSVTLLSIVCQFLETSKLHAWANSMIFLAVLGFLYVCHSGKRFRSIIRYL